MTLIWTLVSCHANSSIAPETTTGTTNNANSNMTSSKESSQTNQTTGVSPSMPGGVVACEFTQQATSSSLKSEIGCRVADANTGHKIDLSAIAGYTFGYEDPKTVLVTMTTPSSDNPWQVLYDLTGNYSALQSIGSLLKVGLKETSTGSTNYQVVNNLTGHLNIMLYGTWKSTCGASNVQAGWTNPPAQYYTVRTDQISTGGQILSMESYSTDPTCTQTPEYTYKYTGVIKNVTFDGMFFYTDIQWNADVLHVNTSAALNYVRANLSCASYGINAALNADVDTMKCDTNGQSSYMEYGAYEINETTRALYPTYPNGSDDGSTSALRENTINSSWSLLKQ